MRMGCTLLGQACSQEFSITYYNYTASSPSTLLHMTRLVGVPLPIIAAFIKACVRMHVYIARRVIAPSRTVHSHSINLHIQFMKRSGCLVENARLMCRLCTDSDPSLGPAETHMGKEVGGVPQHTHTHDAHATSNRMSNA